jgi:SAM-dependent methyltransferase
MMLRFHEIAESAHRVLNPLTDPQVDRIGELAGLAPGTRLLDLCCGKGEMLCRWAKRHGVRGTGVDLSRVFLGAARARAAELGVGSQVEFVEHDAATYRAEARAFDVVACSGATWIGHGLAGTLDILRPALRPGGLALVGEVFWNEPPTDEAVRRVAGGDAGLFATLPGTLDRIEGAGWDLDEVVFSDAEGWERYEAPKWAALRQWLEAHPDDPDAAALRAWRASLRRDYFEVGRRFLGWGVFFLRQARA